MQVYIWLKCIIDSSVHLYTNVHINATEEYYIANVIEIIGKKLYYIILLLIGKWKDIVL